MGLALNPTDYTERQPPSTHRGPTEPSRAPSQVTPQEPGDHPPGSHRWSLTPLLSLLWLPGPFLFPPTWALAIRLRPLRTSQMAPKLISCPAPLQAKIRQTTPCLQPPVLVFYGHHSYPSRAAPGNQTSGLTPCLAQVSTTRRQSSGPGRQVEHLQSGHSMLGTR